MRNNVLSNMCMRDIRYMQLGEDFADH